MRRSDLVLAAIVVACALAVIIRLGELL